MSRQIKVKDIQPGDLISEPSGTWGNPIKAVKELRGINPKDYSSKPPYTHFVIAYYTNYVSGLYLPDDTVVKHTTTEMLAKSEGR